VLTQFRDQYYAGRRVDIELLRATRRHLSTRLQVLSEQTQNKARVRLLTKLLHKWVEVVRDEMTSRRIE
jgi:hypothetical protein